MSTPIQALSVGGIMAALAEKYPSESYALFDQVRNGTGYSKRQLRTADAIALGLWPSRGLELEGFEFKVSRGDWLKELKHPEKADEIATYCDRWWIVAGSPDIVKDEELPAPWGLLVPNGNGKLKARKPAAQLEAKPLDRSFIAAILRRAAETSGTTVQLEEARRRGYDAGKKEEREQLQGHAKSTIEHLQRDIANYKQLIETFEKAAGVSLKQRWDAGHIGDAVRFVREGGVERCRKDLEGLQQQARRIAADIDRHLQSAVSS